MALANMKKKIKTKRDNKKCDGSSCKNDSMVVNGHNL
jgi:hypothetical protein